MLIKVKRDGPRGWHLISDADFDPSRHELWEEPQEIAAPPQPEHKQPQKTKGRRK